jgi:hypothetical protein
MRAEENGRLGGGRWLGCQQVTYTEADALSARAKGIIGVLGCYKCRISLDKLLEVTTV